MKLDRCALLGAALVLLVAPPASAAPELTLTAAHARSTFLRAQAPNTTLYSGTLTLTVANTGSDPTNGAVTVSENLPAGLSALVNHPGLGAGPTAASGSGWTCTGTTMTRCTRADALAPGASYPPIRMTVAVASTAATTLRNAPTVAGGGDGDGASATDDIPVAADACPNGWPATAANPEGADGCTPLDLETPCTTRIALTFDDGPSFYRPQTLAHLRAKGVPATFFDLGMRLEANPQLPRFELAEGHKSPTPPHASTRSARPTAPKSSGRRSCRSTRPRRRRSPRWASPSRRTRSRSRIGTRRGRPPRSATRRSTGCARAWRSCSTTGRSTRPPGRRRSMRCR